MRNLSDELACPRPAVVARSSEQAIASIGEVPEEIMQVDAIVKALSTWPQACIHRRYLWGQSDYAAARELRVPATVYRKWRRMVVCHVTEQLLYRDNQVRTGSAQAPLSRTICLVKDIDGRKSGLRR